MTLAMHRSLRGAAIVAALLVSASSLSSQLIQVSGGTSTLSQSQGGKITVQGPTYSGSAGAGTIAGHVYGGAQFVKRTERATITLGSDTVPFNFPTDIFGNDHYITGVGAGVTGRAAQTSYRGFVGAVSNQFDSPFFEGARLGNPAFVFYESTPLNAHLTSYANVMLSHQISVVNSLEWKLADKSTIAVTAGLGANHPYGAISASVDRPLISVKAAYYASQSQFRRADVETPVTSETDRENILIKLYLSRRMTLVLGRQNFLSPVYGSATNIRSTVNQVSGSFVAEGYSMSASLLQSTYSSNGNTSFTGSVGKQFGPRLSVQESILASKPDNQNATSSYVTNIQEVLTPRWSLSQTINSSDGDNTIGFGGTFLSNFATLSAEYQTYYVPARTPSPFQQAMILNAEVHPFSRLGLTGSTFVSPTGKLLYTVSAESTVSRQLPDVHAASERHAWGKVFLRGRVLDMAGRPVMGAALLFDQLPVYTDSDGYFYLSEQKANWHTLRVLSDHFLDGYHYRVVTAPITVRTSANDAQADLLIVVEKVPLGRR